MEAMTKTQTKTKVSNKGAPNGALGIGRVIDVSRSTSPDPGRSANHQRQSP